MRYLWDNWKNLKRNWISHFQGLTILLCVHQLSTYCLSSKSLFRTAQQLRTRLLMHFSIVRAMLNLANRGCRKDIARRRWLLFLVLESVFSFLLQYPIGQLCICIWGHLVVHWLSCMPRGHSLLTLQAQSTPCDQIDGTPHNDTVCSRPDACKGVLTL